MCGCVPSCAPIVALRRQKTRAKACLKGNDVTLFVWNNPHGLAVLERAPFITCSTCTRTIVWGLASSFCFAHGERGIERNTQKTGTPGITRCCISLLLVTGLNEVSDLRPFFPKSPKIYGSTDYKRRGLGCCSRGPNTKLRIRFKIAGEDFRVILFGNKYHLGLLPHEHQVSFKTKLKG